uniref:Uncharacterized protein n=1 Tax=Triticum urartu TaxID=4572 RepID=A0A8R7TEZ2_TRIUA
SPPFPRAAVFFPRSAEPSSSWPPPFPRSPSSPCPENLSVSSVVVRLVVFTHWFQPGAPTSSHATSSSSSDAAGHRRSIRLHRASHKPTDLLVDPV